MKDNKRFHINGIHSFFTPKKEQDAVEFGVRREWTMNWCVMPIEMNKVVIPILVEKLANKALARCTYNQRITVVRFVFIPYYYSRIAMAQASTHSYKPIQLLAKELALGCGNNA